MHEDPDQVLRFPAESGCFGCSTNNASGLQLSFLRRDGGLFSGYAVPDRFHGAPGVAHGGIVASIFDEISCAAVFFSRGCHVVTGELNVRYQQPCPVETPIEFYAKIVDETHARYAIVEVRGDGEFALELIAVSYDHETAARCAEKHGRPEWAYALRTGFMPRIA
jgi:acyl-coenzyme A thioesterase PaaI-like protein